MARIPAASVVASLLLLSSSLFGCRDKPPKTPTEEDEYAKAFSELEKKDDDDPGTNPVSKMKEGSDGKPKGPVYPAPFTAEQIRDATKNGRTYRYKVEVPGKPPREYVIIFRNVDDAGAEIHTGADHVRRFGWITLQQHSEFPKDKVTTRQEKLKTPAGKFDCVVYVVKDDDDEVWTYYFAKKLPGAPVYYYVERNGKRLRTTTLVEHIPGK